MQLTVLRETDMSDIERAKELLKSKGFTCVMCKGETLYTSEKRGVVPILEKLEQNAELKGFSVADKVIGKAAAMLFHLADISVLYGEIMSVPAKEYLEKIDNKEFFEAMGYCLNITEGQYFKQSKLNNIEKIKKEYYFIDVKYDSELGLLLSDE